MRGIVRRVLMKVFQRWKIYAAFLLCLLMCGILIVFFGQMLLKKSTPYGLTYSFNESDKFREQKISDENLEYLIQLAEKNKLSFSEVLTVAMVCYHFDLSNADLTQYTVEVYEDTLQKLETQASEEFEQLLTSYQAVWNDVVYFPVPESTVNEKAGVTFTNSWMFERNFGGERGHEGTDIMADINQRGYYPIVSMTDGVVEKIGWLPQGGYRLGIRSDSGAYFYYAHLYRYEKEYQVQDVIKAGELIGYMGDSGYGEEGTVGKFDVHLHLGIYIKTENHEEISINSYPVLKYIEAKKLFYAY